MKHSINILILLMLISCTTQTPYQVGENERGLLKLSGTDKYEGEILQPGTHYTNEGWEIEIYSLSDSTCELRSSWATLDSVNIVLKVNYTFRIPESELKRLIIDTGKAYEKVVSASVRGWVWKSFGERSKSDLESALSSYNFGGLIQDLSDLYGVQLINLEVTIEN